MSDNPSWLTPESNAAAPAAPAMSPVEIDTPAAAPPAAAPAAAAAEEAELPGVILTMRLANMGVSIALIVCSVLVLIDIPKIATGVLCVYAICGGLLVCCTETQLKFLRVAIALNFGFLFSAGWRFLYYLLMASVAWSYDDLFGKIVGGCLVATAVYNTYVLCRYPSYRKIREKIAQEEDKRIEARISKEVKKQAVSQLTK